MTRAFDSIKLWMMRRLRVLAVSALVLLMLALSPTLFRTLRRPAQVRVLTPFTATLRTRSISFELGDWFDSTGLFASDAFPVDLTFHGRFRIATDDSSSGQLENLDLTFHNVRLHSLDSTPWLDVVLDVFDDGALHIDLTRRSSTKTKFASVLLDGKSKVVDPRLNRLVPKTGTAEWSIWPDSDNAVELTVRFLVKLPPPENHVLLADGKNMSFEKAGRSAIVGSGSELNVQRTGRRLPLDNAGLRLYRLKSGELTGLGLHVQPGSTRIESLDVTLTGQSDDIRVINAGAESQIAEEPAKPIDWTLVGAVGTGASALGTIIYAFLYGFWGLPRTTGEEGKHKTAERRGKSQSGRKKMATLASDKANNRQKGS